MKTSVNTNKFEYFYL